MTGHPQATGLYGAPKIIWLRVDDYAVRSDCRFYTVAKINAGKAVFFEASAAGKGLIARNTFAQRAKDACNAHRAPRLIEAAQLALKEAA